MEQPSRLDKTHKKGRTAPKRELAGCNGRFAEQKGGLPWPGMVSGALAARPWLAAPATFYREQLEHLSRDWEAFAGIFGAFVK